MTKNAEFVSHKKSKLKVNGKPQLPEASMLREGEIAINFAENVETLSIKNESGDVITFSSDNYYTEQKLGSGFTGEDSATTVTQVIDEIDLVTSTSLNDLEERKQNMLVSGVNIKTINNQSIVGEGNIVVGGGIGTIDQVIDSGTSASTNAVATSAVYGFVTSYTPSITVDQVLDDTTSASTNAVATQAVYAPIADLSGQSETIAAALVDLDDRIIELSGDVPTIDNVIDSGTSASTNAVATSAVYGFVTSYTPTITVDQVLDNTTSASTNPVSSKAVYDAVTDNELVWTNAYVVMSGTVSAHTVDTTIHHTSTSAVTSGSTDVITSGGVYEQMDGIKLKKITQSAYDQLQTKDPNTLYFITD